MFALLALLGISLVMGSFMSFGGGDDDDGDNAKAPGKEKDIETELTLDDEADFVVDQFYQAGLDVLLPALESGEGLDPEDAAELQAYAEQLRAGLVVTQGNMIVDTGAGNDTVFGSAGDDLISTGDGDDLVTGGGEGDDRISLGDGDDTYGYDERENGPQELFPGDEFANWAESRMEGGNDIVRGGAGGDVVSDGYGANLLQGWQGDDYLNAVDQDGVSPDTIQGGVGDDTIVADQGDLIETGTGNDDVIIDATAGVTSGYQVVTIADYRIGFDLVEIELPEGLTAADVTMRDSEDEEDAIVSIGGIDAVRIVGGAGLTPANLTLTAMS